MTHTKAKCLFPLAGVPLIIYALELLVINNVSEVIIVTSRDIKMLKQHVDKFKETHMVGKNCKLKIKYTKLEKSVSLAQALREVNDAEELRDDFILLPADIACNADLSGAFKAHYQAKQDYKEF